MAGTPGRRWLQRAIVSAPSKASTELLPRATDSVLAVTFFSCGGHPRTEGGPAGYRGVRLFLPVIRWGARLAASRCSLAQQDPMGQARAIRGQNAGTP